MNRRDLILAVSAMALARPSGAFAAAPGSLRERARDAWLYVLPLIELASIRSRSTPKGPNVLSSNRTLATAASRVVTAPNNDTLYSAAWLDLTRGPLTLRYAPDARYQSVHLLNMYTDTDAILSRRTVTGAGGAFEIVGPGQRPRTPSFVRVSTPHAWMIVRTLVDGPADLEAAHAAQDRVLLDGPAADPVLKYATREDPARAYFEAAAALVAADPPPDDRGALKRLGLLTPARLKSLSETDWSEIAQGVADARAQILTSLAAPRFVEGWSMPQANIGRFGSDYSFRALIALVGIGALTPDEAIYLSPAGDTGRGEFHGDGLFKFTVPRDFPVSAFWSMTMYEVTPAKQRFLTPNPLDRYSIGDRTPGLVRNGDGSVDLWIGRTDPGGARTANWLPAPAQGPYALSLRAYWPKPELVDGRVRAPAIAPA